MDSQRLDPYTVYYHNREEFVEIRRETFSHHIYFFEPETDAPVIIDAGAHIGMATLYFKKLYPAAKIWAVEPHPVNFELLQKNVTENRLTDVTCIQAALHRTSGNTTLHADTEFDWFSTVSKHAKAWNGQQKTQDIKVPALMLSQLLTTIGQPIDLLKMDIEGAEFDVLQSVAGKLDQIKHIICEFHPRKDNVRDEFTTFLEKRGFEITTEFEKNERYFTQLELIEAVRQ